MSNEEYYKNELRGYQESWVSNNRRIESLKNDLEAKEKEIKRLKAIIESKDETIANLCGENTGFGG